MTLDHLIAWIFCFVISLVSGLILTTTSRPGRKAPMSPLFAVGIGLIVTLLTTTIIFLLGLTGMADDFQIEFVVAILACSLGTLVAGIINVPLTRC